MTAPDTANGPDGSGTDALTISVALDNAQRILRNAEVERDLVLMERLTALANSWTGIAALLAQL
ncbi:hypothetical protein [Streptomyces sp. YIM S03343]